MMQPINPSPRQSFDKFDQSNIELTRYIELRVEKPDDPRVFQQGLEEVCGLDSLTASDILGKVQQNHGYNLILTFQTARQLIRHYSFDVSEVDFEPNFDDPSERVDSVIVIRDYTLKHDEETEASIPIPRFPWPALHLDPEEDIDEQITWEDVEAISKTISKNAEDRAADLIATAVRNGNYEYAAGVLETLKIVHDE